MKRSVLEQYKKELEQECQCKEKEETCVFCYAKQDIEQILSMADALGMEEEITIRRKRDADRERALQRWDRYFWETAKVVALNSRCLSRRMGCLLVKDNRILCTGYNGPPAGVPHCGTARLEKDAWLREMGEDVLTGDKVDRVCPRALLGYKLGERLDICIGAHAERNALITAARYGISTDGASLYVTGEVPCKDCLIEIINAGIKEVVCTRMSFYDDMSKFLVDESGLKVRLFEL